MHSIDAMKTTKTKITKITTYRELASFIATLNEKQLDSDVVIMSEYDAHNLTEARTQNDVVCMYVDDFSAANESLISESLE